MNAGIVADALSGRRGQRVWELRIGQVGAPYKGGRRAGKVWGSTSLGRDPGSIFDWNQYPNWDMVAELVT